MKRWLIWALALLFLGAFLNLYGCALAKVEGRVTAGIELAKYQSYYVVRHARDKRHIDEVIRDEMKVLGLNAESGLQDSKPVGVDVVVFYEDRWTWDMANYLLTLRIDFRDAKSNELLASGQSYRPSLERKPPDFMAREILDSIFKKK